ncbi:hypothetical protein WJX73_001466 [Symbiochloris irregularis]|uniref:COP9 signalosome complex subunit 6 n=1 Tax=Symbiochloris irregularis TaxID=706552 RepID=A0AAW1NN05_9CHLO
MEPPATKKSSSGLEFHLHPLVMINVSDHYMRTRANLQATQSSGDIKVLGILLGQQTGRVVDISNSFEIKIERDAQGNVSIDDVFLTRKQEQYKQTFSKLDVVGWYCTGAQLQPQDMGLHQKMMSLNESPVFLLLNPYAQPGHQKDLPVLLFESELQVEEAQHKYMFVQAAYTVETSEAERIGINQVAKALPSGSDRAADQLVAHYTTAQSAIQVLSDHVAALYRMLDAMAKGELPYDHQLVRQASSLVRRLPAVKSAEFSKDYMTEYNDALLTVLLASMTKGSQSMLEVVDKYNVAYDYKAKGRARGGSQFDPSFMAG